MGGCAVDCKGVCVEIVAAGTKGPMQTTGAECELGGGDNGGGDNGGGENPPPGQFSKQPKYVGEMNIGGNYVTNISSGFNNLLDELWWVKYGIGDIRQNSFNLNYHAIAIQNNTDSMVKSLDFLTSKSIETSDNIDKNFKSLIDAVKSGDSGSSGGGLDGLASDVAAIKGDVSSLVAMNQHAMSSYFSNISSKSNQMESHLRKMPGTLNTMSDQIEGQNRMLSGYLDPMNSNLYEMKALLKDIRNSSNGTGTGSGEGEGAAEIDYSKMPGTEGNPIHVAGAKYSSRVCLDGMNCAFDLQKVNEEYSDAKQEMARRYDEIKKEVSETFKFELNGSASTPKCFDMFSLYGKSYSVCPDSGEYWNTLAAILMFIFYFIALMIVARR